MIKIERVKLIKNYNLNQIRTHHGRPNAHHGTTLLWTDSHAIIKNNFKKHIRFTYQNPMPLTCYFLKDFLIFLYFFSQICKAFISLFQRISIEI